MTRFSSRTFSTFLLGTALAFTLVACDGEKDTADTGDTSIISGEQIDASPVFYTNPADQKPSWVGSYLASRVAQNRFDWSRAESFLAQVNDLKPGNALLDRRLMLLAMGAGDFDQALTSAKQSDPKADPSGLTSFILMLEPIRAEQYITARGMLDDMPDSILSSYAMPIMRAWLDAASGKLNFDGVRNDPLYFYQMVLIADYLNQIDLVADPARLTSMRTQITGLSAEHMGDIFLRHQKFDLAASLYDMTNKINPGGPALTDKIAAAKNQQTTGLDKLNLAQPVANASQGIAGVMFDMASNFYNEQSYESAQLFAQMALTLYPDMVEPRLLLGNILAHENQIDAAIKMFQGIPETSSRYMAVQQQMAAFLTEQNNDDAAIKALRGLIDAANTTDEKIDYLMQIGDTYRNREQFDQALSAYNDAFKLLDNKIDAEHWDMLYARGMTLERLKRWADAEADLQAAIKYQPDHPYLLNYLAYSWADRGIHLEESLAMLTKAMKFAPSDGYITDSAGWVYYKLGRFEDAAKFLEQAVELMPYDATVNDHLGDAYFRVGRTREAEFQWRRALNYSKDDAQKAALQGKIDRGL